MTNTVKLALLSDIHGGYPMAWLRGLEEHMMIIAGDLCAEEGDEKQFGYALDWLAEARRKVRHLIVIAGNHDGYLAGPNRLDAERRLGDVGVIYLCDSGIEIDDVKFYGSPWIEDDFGDWFFGLPEKKLGLKFDQIPIDTDVLITHSPPYGMLDATRRLVHTGSKALLERVREIGPAVHVFGHMHEAAGVVQIDDMLIVNACVTPAMLQSGYLKLTRVELKRNEAGRWGACEEG